MRILVLVCSVLMLSSCSYERLLYIKQKQKDKLSPLEQVDLQEMVERYMYKDQPSIGTIEGIYSVSAVVTKKGKTIFSSRDRERVTDRKENYTKVAILKDNSLSGREFIEIVLDKEYRTSFSVFGEFSQMAESNLLLYKHFDSKGRSTSFTFTYDKTRDVLEGVRTDDSGKFTVTYQLTYVKISPKASVTP